MEEIEIPEAIRENTELSERSKLSLPLIIGVIMCLGVAGLLSVFSFLPTMEPAPKVDDLAAESKPSPSPAPKSAELKSTTPTPTEIEPATSASKGLLGHLPYDVALESELEPISADGRLKMRLAAAKKFQQMQAAARADGIELVAISAFRDHQTQEELFFGVKEQRVQDATERAEVSAPPGYSEHHTGYAIDIGDGRVPATNLEKEFANTDAFAWLEQNALKYSFELSFPVNNKQGVSYEPWHWRFVGDRDSLETFYKVRN